jgi:hypothetical protein
MFGHNGVIEKGNKELERFVNMSKLQRKRPWENWYKPILLLELFH